MGWNEALRILCSMVLSLMGISEPNGGLVITIWIEMLQARLGLQTEVDG
jgi:hypothetical protein